MKPPDEVLRDHVHQWIAKADVDLRTAEWLMTAPNPIRDSIAFHCQQAAEKYLKALLVSLQVEFPKTHDLEELLDILSTVAAEVAADLEGIKFLNPFGVKIRYPGDFPELLPGKERKAFELAAGARETVITALNRRLAKG